MLRATTMFWHVSALAGFLTTFAICIDEMRNCNRIRFRHLRLAVAPLTGAPTISKRAPASWLQGRVFNSAPLTADRLFS